MGVKKEDTTHRAAGRVSWMLAYCAGCSAEVSMQG